MQLFQLRMTTGCSKTKTNKQKNTFRAITDNADAKRERDKKLGPNLNFFYETTSEQVVVIIMCYKKKQKKKEEISHCYKKKNRNQSNLTWGI